MHETDDLRATRRPPSGGSLRGERIAAIVAAHQRGASPSAVVLVEGASDELALRALAARRGRNLSTEVVEVVPIGGAHAIDRFLRELGPLGLNLKLAGLCDAAEQEVFGRALARYGFGRDLGRADMEALGFFVCEADLEDELIRCLGTARVERVIEQHGELHSLRTMQRQPAQRGRPIDAQLRRFMGTRGGRKIQYARALVEALDLDTVPPSLDRLLAHI